MIIKLATIFNVPAQQQAAIAAKSNFYPKHLETKVKNFHPASTSSNAPLIENAKQQATSGIPKTKWWAKMEKAQLN